MGMGQQTIHECKHRSEYGAYFTGTLFANNLCFKLCLPELQEQLSARTSALPPVEEAEEAEDAEEAEEAEDVDLGLAANFVIISETAIGNTGLSETAKVDGNIAVAVSDATITGFALTLDVGTKFSTSSQITNGKAYAANYGGTTPSMVSTAVTAMHDAYDYAASRTPTRGSQAGAIVLGTTLGGLNTPFKPGVYHFGAAVTNVGDIHFDGTASDIFVIQITGAFAQATLSNVVLLNGAYAENIFWQIGGAATLAAGAHMEGNILSLGAIALAAGSNLKGRALSRMVVTLGADATITT
jgi:hypothetical protein